MKRLLVTLLALALTLPACGRKEIHHRQILQFGTIIDVTLVADRALAERAFEMLEKDFARMQHDWQVWKPGPLMTLNEAIAAGKTVTPAPSPTPADHITSLNGVPYSEFIILDPETEAHVREIYERGQALGRDPHAFSKLGDSLIATKHFLRVFDGRDPNLGGYNLGEYAYLQDTIDYFAGSFQRYGRAVRLGMNTRMVFDPKWADEEACGAGVNLLDCEIWAHNPSFMFVQLGTNDHRSLALFQENYERIVEYLIYQGIVPILFTKADRLADPLNQNNAIIREIAATYHVPLIDMDRLADTLPNRGLKADNIHLNAPDRYDYARPETFRHGTAIHSLAALIMLDYVRAIVASPENRPTITPTP